MAVDMPPDTAPGAARGPGVYVEHGWSAAGEQAAPRTGIPAFIGFGACRGAARGDSGCRVLQRREQFDGLFDGMPSTAYLGHALRGFFENGGTRCVVVPAGAGVQGPAAMTAALTALLNPGGVLEDVDQADLVCVPDLMLLAQANAPAAALEVQHALLDHCGRMGDRFAILDALPDTATAAPALKPQEGRRVEAALRQWDALAPGAGALYFPWTCVQAPRRPQAAAPAAGGAEVTLAVPPCGHVAGVYARTDRRAGPHQAPANELLHQVLRLDVDLSDEHHAALNDKGVNCLRSVPGRGIRVCGARTLCAQPGWRYVNVKRLFLSLARWVEHHCNDLVFEANDARLWERLAQRLRAYCHALHDAGALAGRTAADAFHVKCDAETNPRAVRAAGVVVAEVGLAPLAPAEFIVVRITRHAGSVAVGMPADIR